MFKRKSLTSVLARCTIISKCMNKDCTVQFYSHFINNLLQDYDKALEKIEELERNHVCFTTK